MPILNVINLTTHTVVISETASVFGSTLTIAGSATLAGRVVTDDQFSALNPLLLAEQAAGNISWTVARGTTVKSSGGIVTIYARTTGSDVTGNGSLAAPYATFQRAVQDVPLNISAGSIYRVDITGINETLPTDYTLPSWKAPDVSGLAATLPPADTLTIFQAPVEIFATPQAVAALPLADTVINSGDVSSVTTDAITGLRTIHLTTPRASWTTANLKGKQVIDGGSAGNNCVVAEVTTSTILLANAASPTYPLHLVEPSARLHGAPTNLTGSIHAFNVDCLGFTGIKITSDAGANGLVADGAGQCVCQLCELESPALVQTGGGLFFSSANRIVRCWVYGSPSIMGSVGIVQCMLDGLTTGILPLLIAPLTGYFRRVVVENCEPIEVTVFEPGGSTDGATTPHLTIQNTLIKGGTGDGLVFHGTKGHVTNVDVRGCAGNGITVNMGSGLLDLHNVGSSASNTGFGILVNDGMQVVVDAATSGNSTPLNGTAGQTKVGNVAAQTWAAFTSAGSNTTDYSGATASGARLTLK